MSKNTVMVLSPSDMPAPKVHVVYLNYWYEPEMDRLTICLRPT